MEHKHQKSYQKINQLLKQNILTVPGVASIPTKKSGSLAIDITKNNLGSVVNIDINCFSYVNIWAVMRQVQNRAKYILEKNSTHKNPVVVNVNVFDLIEEDVD